MTPLAQEPRHSVEALSFLYMCVWAGGQMAILEIHVSQALAADRYARVLCS
jgi:hypothetical protein